MKVSFNNDIVILRYNSVDKPNVLDLVFLGDIERKCSLKLLEIDIQVVSRVIWEIE